jgi:hypothetical protein
MTKDELLKVLEPLAGDTRVCVLDATGVYEDIIYTDVNEAWDISANITFPGLFLGIRPTFGKTIRQLVKDHKE